MIGDIFDLKTADSRSSTMVEDLRSSRRSRNQAIFPLNLEDASDLERALMVLPAAVVEATSGTWYLISASNETHGLFSRGFTSFLT